jgi:hypothetical protein
VFVFVCVYNIKNHCPEVRTYACSLRTQYCTEYNNWTRREDNREVDEIRCEEVHNLYYLPDVLNQIEFQMGGTGDTCMADELWLLLYGDSDQLHTVDQTD